MQQDKLKMKPIKLLETDSKKFLDIVYAVGWEYVAAKVGKDQAEKLKRQLPSIKD